MEETEQEKIIRILRRSHTAQEMFAIMTGDIFAESSENWWLEKGWTQQEYCAAVMK